MAVGAVDDVKVDVTFRDICIIGDVNVTDTGDIWISPSTKIKEDEDEEVLPQPVEVLPLLTKLFVPW